MYNHYEEYFKKVARIAKHKYELDEDIVEGFSSEIIACYDNDFPASRTVEYLAKLIFDLKN